VTMRVAAKSFLALVLSTAACTLAGAPPAISAADRARFPEHVETIDGEAIDLAAIAKTKTLVVVTVKATWCPVCRRQLERIQEKRTELERCGVSFVVLGPGPREELRKLRDETGSPDPFVEDRDLAIAGRLGLRLGEDQIEPAILILEPDLEIGWAQLGRSERFYGDGALQRKVDCWLSV